MYYIRILAGILSSIVFFNYSIVAQKRDFLCKSYTIEKIEKILLNQDQWHPFPKYFERDKWEKLPESLKKNHILLAEKHLHCKWENPTASLFMEYYKNGNRSNYQSAIFNKRVKLAELVIGECVEGKGRFFEDIMNGVWSICEETYWGVPAHMYLQSKKNDLPDIMEPTVDLFAAETGMLIAWTYYLLGKDLNQLSPVLYERMAYEVDKKIITPNEQRDDFWWMGNTSKALNNWTPWICSNWLIAVLSVEKSDARRIKSVHKILQCLDRFLNPYPNDGGCDEGPGYWTRAGGSLFDCLETLAGASGGQINIFNEKLIGDIGRYIAKSNIHNEYFINFADSPPKVNLNPSLVYRFGKCIQDQEMMKFGSFLARLKHLDSNMLIKENFGTLNRALSAMFSLQEVLDIKPAEPLYSDFWLPDIQVMGGRSIPNSFQGLYLAAQAGHNAESHNHNDVGNFIVYLDGKPVIIDVGPEEYTAKTFSNKRYEIWTMQSGYHNLPTINGYSQKEGKEYHAENVKFKSDKNKVVFSMDLSKAYPKKAEISKWYRSITLNRGKNIILMENYTLKKMQEKLILNFMTCRKPVIEKEGTINFENRLKSDDKKSIVMEYDSEKFTPEIEEIKIKDDKLFDDWGSPIYRIKLICNDLLLSDEYKVRFIQK
jgi:hypothetical protein